MLKVKAGELDKLGLLFERYNRRLYSYFYRLTYRRDISEDLVQGVFERVIKYRHTYTGDGAFSTWIYQVARNMHADHFRDHQKRDSQDDLFDPEMVKSDEMATEFEFESENSRELRLLEAALDRLDPEKKETLILSRYQGFKYTEIAEIMDCSVGAVKVRIFRTLNELKEIISDLKKNHEL